MTDDIVARLEASYAFLRDPLHIEARDEIERLRQQLADAQAAAKVTKADLRTVVDLTRRLSIAEKQNAKMAAALRLLIEWHDDTGAAMLDVLIDVARTALAGEKPND